MNQLAKHLVAIATGEVTDPEPSPRQRRARKAGKAGGSARAAKLTSEQRADIARTAAEARWKKS